MRISSGVGFGLERRSPSAAMICPGVQYPHCMASSLRNACWTFPSSSPFIRPSMVVISCPSASSARIRQAYRGRSSTSTVQDPHSPRSQPGFVPVRPAFSRKTVSRVSRGSALRLSARPFTFNVSLTDSRGPTTGAGVAGAWLKATVAAGATPTEVRKPRRLTLCPLLPCLRWLFIVCPAEEGVRSRGAKRPLCKISGCDNGQPGCCRDKFGPMLHSGKGENPACATARLGLSDHCVRSGTRRIRFSRIEAPATMRVVARIPGTVNRLGTVTK